MTNGRMIFVMWFVSLAVLLVWFAGREPEWAAPLILLLLGVVTAAMPRPSPETERMRGRIRAPGAGRRLGVVAAIVGLTLLLRSLGVM